MSLRRLSGLLVGSIFGIAACAESAIPIEEEPSDEGDDVELDASVEPVEQDDEDDELDARTPPPRADAGPRDAGRDARSADPGDEADGGLDAGRADAGRDAAVKDAAEDAAEPPDPEPMACPSGQTRCEDACVNTASDEAHCGMCGRACQSGQSCSAGTCMAPTPSFEVPEGCTAKMLGSRGYAFCTSTRSWEEARQSCQSADLDLALIDNDDENEFVRGNGASWFGGNDRSSENTWVAIVPGGRVDGARLTYVQWAMGEPNNQQQCEGTDIPVIGCVGGTRDEDCGVINANGSWNDADCSERKRYVCEAY